MLQMQRGTVTLERHRRRITVLGCVALVAGLLGALPARADPEPGATKEPVAAVIVLPGSQNFALGRFLEGFYYPLAKVPIPILRSLPLIPKLSVIPKALGLAEVIGRVASIQVSGIERLDERLVRRWKPSQTFDVLLALENDAVKPFLEEAEFEKAIRRPLKRNPADVGDKSPNLTFAEFETEFGGFLEKYNAKRRAKNPKARLLSLDDLKYLTAEFWNYGYFGLPDPSAVEIATAYIEWAASRTKGATQFVVKGFSNGCETVLAAVKQLMEQDPTDDATGETTKLRQKQWRLVLASWASGSKTVEDRAAEWEKTYESLGAKNKLISMCVLDIMDVLTWMQHQLAKTFRRGERRSIAARRAQQILDQTTDPAERARRFENAMRQQMLEEEEDAMPSERWVKIKLSRAAFHTDARTMTVIAQILTEGEGNAPLAKAKRVLYFKWLTGREPTKPDLAALHDLNFQNELLVRGRQRVLALELIDPSYLAKRLATMLPNATNAEVNEQVAAMREILTAKSENDVTALSVAAKRLLRRMAKTLPKDPLPAHDADIRLAHVRPVQGVSAERFTQTQGRKPGRPIKPPR